MANPTTTSGDIHSIFFDSRADGQQLLLTTHWSITDESSGPFDLFKMYEACADKLEELGGFLATLMACYSNEVEKTRILIQKIYPTRYIHYTRNPASPDGEVDSPLMPPQVSHAIVLRATESGPTAKGTKKIGGCPQSFTEGGYITAAGNAALDDLKGYLDSEFNFDVEGSPCYLKPIIFHRAAPVDSKDVFASEVLQTTRSQRRRTVGYGA